MTSWPYKDQYHEFLVFWLRGVLYFNVAKSIDFLKNKINILVA